MRKRDGSVGETTGCGTADIAAKLASLLTFKTVLAVLTISGVVIAFLDILDRPDGLLPERFPKRPTWLSWLGWSLISISAIGYMLLDYFEVK